MRARIVRLAAPQSQSDPQAPSSGRATPSPATAHPPAVLRGRRPPRSVAARDGTADGQPAAGQPEPPDAPVALGQPIVDLRRAVEVARARGHERGLAEGRAELADAVEAAGALARELEALVPREAMAVAHSIVELGLAVARRIVGATLERDPSILVGAVEQAAAKMDAGAEARVHVHSAVVDVVRAAWEERHGTAYLGKRWAFEADPSLPPGGCIVRFEHGFVDAGLDAQLEELGIALDAAVPSLVAELADREPRS